MRGAGDPPTVEPYTGTQGGLEVPQRVVLNVLIWLQWPACGTQLSRACKERYVGMASQPTLQLVFACIAAITLECVPHQRKHWLWVPRRAAQGQQFEIPEIYYSH